ncbi:DUF5655 domain-containing protein [Caulobacter sp. 17J65-9]|uniref:DUF5655 domain-containing protein n=1 Tax=Caulobacter sp. 17J65-9 TaxID=2709382 RepID=UPI0013C844AB|nr:DUF5655 domain-containing protein [Caulobacter sp. 17J65-9]NEX91350.1 DUF4287 domain-containing protein [Caulobacter sp. 17J65-9]
MAKRDANITERQAKWFAAVREGLERETGKTLEQWAEIARGCPETAHRARLEWLKAHHGLGQNRASTVLDAAFPNEMGWDDPDALRAALWADPASRAIFEAVAAAASAHDDVTEGQRKGYTAWSRKVKFAAVKPLKGGAASLGLAVPPEGERLAPRGKSESWSDRLKSTVRLEGPQDVDAEIAALLKRAYEAS